MSAVEYNSLIFEIGQRLDKLNLGRKLIIMCRGKVAPRSKENMQNTSFSLFEELEENKFLGPDHLDLLKDLLKGFKEWALLEEVEKFESKRKEYDVLLKRIVRVLDKLNDVERLVTICREHIPQERQGNIHDVQSLFQELENNNSLGINYLVILKEILAQTEKNDLLKVVEEYEERRIEEDKFERRKARAAAIKSAAGGNLTGVLDIKTIFKGIAGGIVIASAFEFLRRDSTYDQLASAINTCVLPAGAQLIKITEGGGNLKVQTEHLLALDNLWRMYKNETLKARLEALFITDEMLERARGGVEVIVTIDQQEYEKARDELTTEARGLYLDQEKYAYIQDYLKKSSEQSKDIDTHSVTAKTSDSGMLGPNSASSESGTEITSDSTSICLKDVDQRVTIELTSRLKSDPVALERFYRAFGLDPMKLHTKELWDIKDLFPDTPINTLKDVFEALQLYDLADLLEKVTRPRALRPAISLKEIEQLPTANNRPTKIYSKAEVLIINYPENGATDDAAENFGCFFQALHSQSQVTTLTAEASWLESFSEDLDTLRKREKKIDFHTLTTNHKESHLQKRLERKIPNEQTSIYPDLNEQLLGTLQKQEEEGPIRKGLRELEEKRKEWTKEKMLLSEKIKQKEEELKKKKEEFKITVSTHIDKWIQYSLEKGEESTLFVIVVNLSKTRYNGDFRKCIIRGCLKEKLMLIPDPKLVIFDDLSSMMEMGAIPRETLQMYLPRQIGLGKMLELLNKRYKSLDLIAMMFELKRTFLSTIYDRFSYIDVEWYPSRGGVEIDENLSCLPRLQRTEQI